MDDASWAYGEVTSQAKDVRGRWRVCILWYGTDDKGHPSQREDLFVMDEAKIRRLEEQDGGQAQP